MRNRSIAPPAPIPFMPAYTTGIPTPLPAHQMDLLYRIESQQRRILDLLENREPEPENISFNEMREKLGRNGKKLSYKALNRRIEEAGLTVEGDCGGKYIKRKNFFLLK